MWDADGRFRMGGQTRLAGVSVSQVARRYDVNANLVFTWRRDPRFNPPPVEDPAALFLPVEVVAAPAAIDPPNISAKPNAQNDSAAIQKSRKLFVM